MNAKLNTKLNAKSLACWFLIAASCPQVLAIAPSQAQNQAQNQVSAKPTSETDVVAVASRITDINASMSGDRLNLKLNFASSDRPQLTYTRQGKEWVALLNGAQLQLDNGNASYAQANPMPGITSIEATQYAANKVRIRVSAANPEVFKEMINRQDTGDSLVLSLEMQASANPNSQISAANASESGTLSSPQNTPNSNKVLTAQATTDSVGKPLFEPKITIIGEDGKTRVAQSSSQNTTPPAVVNPVSPQLPGRVPGVVPPFRQLRTPPVGDIATSTSKLRPDLIDLGTAERVPRITLRDAPAIEVLTLIGRVAGLSVVSAEPPAAAGAGATATAAVGGLKQPVSLSVENETAQDVFNNVLRISGLEANRIGQTIFVATKLPVTLKNLATKSYRLNQITAGEASAYLIGLGASRVVTRQRVIPGAQTATVGTTATSTVVTTPTEGVPTLETVAITAESGATPLLKGLQVVAEERGNTLTLIGSPKQIEFAESQLARIDSRKRQVVVNVRVVDVTLTKGQTFGFGFGFTDAAGSTRSTINTTSPSATLGQPIPSGILQLDFNNPFTGVLSGTQSLLATLNASIANNQSKILTDPSITVQEGESASISITDEVVNRVNETSQANGNIVTVTRTVELKEVGLNLNIKVDRIDDNGFINLSVSPTISSPLAPIASPSNPGAIIATPISKRSLTSGAIRLRDNQTLVLSGVIRDSDRNTTTKVPILGDLPIIGALFRTDTTSNSRSEIVIVVTPRIIDDSQNANWGYTYQPTPEAQKVIDSNQRKIQ